jgi:hypothetical protein
MKPPKTQKEALLRAFRKGIFISQNKAQEICSTTRLAAYIFIFKKEGMTFEKRKRVITNRYGNRCSFIEYRLKK